jgi:hypothetical protein
VLGSARPKHPSLTCPLQRFGSTSGPVGEANQKAAKVVIHFSLRPSSVCRDGCVRLHND